MKSKQPHITVRQPNVFTIEICVCMSTLCHKSNFAKWLSHPYLVWSAHLLKQLLQLEKCDLIEQMKTKSQVLTKPSSLPMNSIDVVSNRLWQISGASVIIKHHWKYHFYYRPCVVNVKQRCNWISARKVMNFYVVSDINRIFNIHFVSGVWKKNRSSNYYQLKTFVWTFISSQIRNCVKSIDRTTNIWEWYTHQWAPIQVILWTERIYEKE